MTNFGIPELLKQGDGLLTRRSTERSTINRNFTAAVEKDLWSTLRNFSEGQIDRTSDVLVAIRFLRQDVDYQQCRIIEPPEEFVT
jgi:hypothetical protein